MPAEATATNVGGFRNITVSSVSGPPSPSGISLEWLNTDTSQWYSARISLELDGSVFEFFPSATNNQHVLDAIYAAWDAGTITAADVNPAGPDYAYIIEHYHYNPLDRNGFANFVRARRLNNRMGAGAVLTDQAIDLRDGFEVVPTPASTELVALTPFEAVAHGGNNYAIRIDIPTFEGVTRTNIGQYAELRALGHWLNDRRVEGTGDGSEIVAGDGAATWRGGGATINYAGDRQFVLGYTSQNTQTIDGVAYITRWSIGITAGTNFDRDALAQQFAAVSVNIGTPRVDEPHPFGSHLTDLRARGVIFTDQVRLDAVNGVPTWQVRNQGSMFWERVKVGSHRVIDYADLPSGSAIRTLPHHIEMPLAGELHFHGTAQGNLRLPRPTYFADNSGSGRPFLVANQGTANLLIDDWTGTDVCILHPKERAEFLFVYDRDGSGRVLGRIPQRRHFLLGGYSQYVWPGTSYAFDDSTWIMGAKAPTPGTADFLDSAAFEIGTGAYPGNGTAYNAANLAFTPDAIKVKKSGTLTFYQAIELTAPAGSGILPQGHETVLTIKRGSSLVEVPLASYALLDSGEQRTYTWLYPSQRVQAGDILYPQFKYERGTSLNFTASEIDSFLRAVVLDQDIVIEESA